MPLPHDTSLAVGARDRGRDFRYASRSLMLDRFANPELEKDDRRDFFNNAFGKFDSHVARAAVEARREFLSTLPGLKPDDLIFAQLQSRLMVNMAGGVMENAGLCLDRFGLPYIPGSAVKGCARRMAVQQLFGCATNTPNPVALGALLADIARAFGWCEQDWSSETKDDQFTSDFAYACGSQIYRQAWKSAAESLSGHYHWPVPEKLKETPWEALPNLAGSVGFMAAYPVSLEAGPHDGLPLEVPHLGKLEMDVVTVHHRIYYSQEPEEPQGLAPSQPKWKKWKEDHDRWLAHRSAPDIEDPVPNVFPAVAQGHVFVFAVHLLRENARSFSQPDKGLLELCRRWLADGLQILGLGAKTSAGYGWFAEVSNAVKPLWQLSCEVAAFHRQAAAFTHWPEDQRIEFVLRLSDLPNICGAWRRLHPDTFASVEAFAQSQVLPLP